jgi:putative membrane protein
MYTPFIIVAGTKMDNAKNKNIQITNGKIVDNGESTLAVGIAMPGMQENIGISKSKIDIPEEIEISMETEDFEMGNIIAVVAVKGIDEDLTSDLNSMYSQINELANASNEILAGANQLKEGTSELVSGVDQLKDGTGAAYAGSKQIKDEVEESTKNLKNDNTPAIDSKTLEAIKAQAMQSATLSDEQKAGIKAQAKAGATLTDAQKAGIAAQAKAGATLTDTQKAAIKAEAQKGATFTDAQKTAIIEEAQKKYPTELTEAEKQLILAVAQDTAYQTAEATALKVAQDVATQTAEATALKVAQDVATQTAETTALTVAQSTATQTAGATATQTATQVGNQAKQKFTNQVVSQMSTLGTALDELTNGLANIDNGVSALSVGTNKLDSGALQLANGVKTFNEQGISKINNLVNGDLRNIASRVEKMNELANEYNNYAGIQNGMAGEVKFIMITDSTTGNGEVKKEEAVITTEAKETKETKENKDE